LGMMSSGPSSGNVDRLARITFLWALAIFRRVCLI
jgi:hypothetical protein